MSSLLAARNNILRSGKGTHYPIHDIVLESNASEFNLPNLVGNAESQYLLKAWFTNATATLLSPAININGDDAGSNYDRQYEHTINATAPAVSESNTAAEGTLTSGLINQNDMVFVEALISGKGGQTAGHIITGSLRSVGNAAIMTEFNIQHNDTSEISRIDLVCANPFPTAQFLAGSRVQLFAF